MHVCLRIIKNTGKHIQSSIAKADIPWMPTAHQNQALGPRRLLRGFSAGAGSPDSSRMGFLPLGFLPPFGFLPPLGFLPLLPVGRGSALALAFALAFAFGLAVLASLRRDLKGQRDDGYNPLKGWWFDGPCKDQSCRNHKPMETAVHKINQTLSLYVYKYRAWHRSPNR